MFGAYCVCSKTVIDVEELDGSAGLAAAKAQCNGLLLTHNVLLADTPEREVSSRKKAPDCGGFLAVERCFRDVNGGPSQHSLGSGVTSGFGRDSRVPRSCLNDFAIRTTRLRCGVVRARGLAIVQNLHEIHEIPPLCATAGWSAGRHGREAEWQSWLPLSEIQWQKSAGCRAISRGLRVRSALNPVSAQFELP